MKIFIFTPSYFITITLKVVMYRLFIITSFYSKPDPRIDVPRGTNALPIVMNAVTDNTQRVGTRFTRTTRSIVIKGYTMHALP